MSHIIWLNGDKLCKIIFISSKFDLCEVKLHFCSLISSEFLTKNELLLRNFSLKFWTRIQQLYWRQNLKSMFSLTKQFSLINSFWSPLIRIPTVKLKIPGKAFLKSESRTSVAHNTFYICHNFFMVAYFLSPNRCHW